MFAAICGAVWVRPPSMRMWPALEVIRMAETPPPTYQVLPYTLNGSWGRPQPSHHSQAWGGSGLRAWVSLSAALARDNSDRAPSVVARSGLFMPQTVSQATCARLLRWLERQSHVVLRHALLRGGRIEQVFELCRLHPRRERVAGKLVQLPGHPPGKSFGPPD